VSALSPYSFQPEKSTAASSFQQFLPSREHSNLPQLPWLPQLASNHRHTRRVDGALRNRCDSTSGRGRNLAVPLSQLAAIDADESTAEAIGEWHYWVAQGYRL